MQANVWDFERVVAYLLDEEDQLDGQPANGKDRDDDDDHPRDPPLSANGLLGLVASRGKAVETPEHQTVHETHGAQWDDVAEREEADVEETSQVRVRDVRYVGAGGTVLVEVLVVENVELAQQRDVA